MNRNNETILARPSDRELLFTRSFDAPRELVYKAWIDPQQLAQWWGPNGFTLTTKDMEVKAGGAWRFIMHGPDGTDYKNRIVYIEVQEPTRLVYRHAGEEGDEPVHFKVTVTFEEQDGQTNLTMHMVFDSKKELDYVIEKYGADQGGIQTINRLAEHIARERIVFKISRVFDAPRDLVWRAWTDPTLLPQWWGPKGFKVTYHKLDLRPGGTFHYCMQSEQGQEMWGKFRYREIEKPNRLIFINSFSDKEGNITRHPGAEQWPLEMLSTITFEDENGKTKVTIRWEPINATPEEEKVFADNHASMQGGWTGTLERLVQFLEK